MEVILGRQWDWRFTGCLRWRARFGSIFYCRIALKPIFSGIYQTNSSVMLASSTQLEYFATLISFT